MGKWDPNRTEIPLNNAVNLKNEQSLHYARVGLALPNPSKGQSVIFALLKSGFISSDMFICDGISPTQQQQKPYLNIKKNYKKKWSHLVLSFFQNSQMA